MCSVAGVDRDIEVGGESVEVSVPQARKKLPGQSQSAETFNQWCLSHRIDKLPTYEAPVEVHVVGHEDPAIETIKHLACDVLERRRRHHHLVRDSGEDLDSRRYTAPWIEQRVVLLRDHPIPDLVYGQITHTVAGGVWSSRSLHIDDRLAERCQRCSQRGTYERPATLRVDLESLVGTQQGKDGGRSCAGVARQAQDSARQVECMDRTVLQDLSGCPNQRPAPPDQSATLTERVREGL